MSALGILGWAVITYLTIGTLILFKVIPKFQKQIKTSHDLRVAWGRIINLIGPKGAAIVLIVAVVLTWPATVRVTWIPNEPKDEDQQK